MLYLRNPINDWQQTLYTPKPPVLPPVDKNNQAQIGGAEDKAVIHAEKGASSRGTSPRPSVVEVSKCDKSTAALSLTAELDPLASYAGPRLRTQSRRASAPAAPVPMPETSNLPMTSAAAIRSAAQKQEVGRTPSVVPRALRPAF